MKIGNPDTTAWYIKPFWRKTWGAMNGVGFGALGATTFFAEFGQYEDQFGAGEINLCAAGFLGRGGNLGNFCTNNTTALNAFGQQDFATAFITGSEVQRWGLGVVQEIDAAAMHVWARWQHQEINDLSIIGFSTDPGNDCFDGVQGEAGLRRLGVVPSRRDRLLLNRHSEPTGNGSRPLGGGFFFASAI